ncbi:TraB/GumN family protein [Pseudoalteromonas obscura]|uniref:TraB/GumN family protein n=1 Tax=Pseudoalteromonas obscura TaxID=3048491 RepID=A0ABT7EQ59_9GAMM|nr:TraB/GumN family protein [Pseudoalteromonas sp. P94(2023)]MDK2597133.1 TraB/GumN family protein [Pseudoalteromonas sp. P94(2023)]
MKHISFFKLVSSFCLLLFFSTLSQAAPALWSVEKNEVTSYLFGTVHVGDPSMQGLPDKVKSAIEQSENTVVELNMSALSPFEIQNKTAAFIANSNSRPLPQAVSQKVYKQLETYFTKRGINIALFNSTPAWAVILTIVQLEYQKAGLTDTYGIDKQVIAHAIKHKKNIKELELFEQQLEMFSQIAIMSDEMVTQTLSQMREADDFIKDMIEAWKTGDDAILSKYYELSFDDSKYARLAEQVLVIERNHTWVRTLLPDMSKTSHFIAVGALHLPKQHGLIELLKAQGFIVKRI